MKDGEEIPRYRVVKQMNGMWGILDGLRGGRFVAGCYEKEDADHIADALNKAP